MRSTQVVQFDFDDADTYLSEEVMMGPDVERVAALVWIDDKLESGGSYDVTIQGTIGNSGIWVDTALAATGLSVQTLGQIGPGDGTIFGAWNKYRVQVVADVGNRLTVWLVGLGS